jgi:hypothetical protein
MRCKTSTTSSTLSRASTCLVPMLGDTSTLLYTDPIPMLGHLEVLKNWILCVQAGGGVLRGA